jgi:hypothetical protein
MNAQGYRLPEYTAPMALRARDPGHRASLAMGRLTKIALISVSVLFAAKVNANDYLNTGYLYTPATVNTVNNLVMLESSFKSFNKGLGSDKMSDEEWENGSSDLFVEGYAEREFIPTSARRRQNLAKFLDGVRLKSPALADSLAGQLKSETVFNDVDKAMRASAYNFADAQAVYWITLWEASNGLVRNTSREEFHAVRDQVIASLNRGQFPAFFSMEEMQDISENMLLTSIVIVASLEAAKKDPAALKAYASDMMEAAKASGFDMAKITLTDQGFVPRK